jgi:hypothetical protein
MKRKLPGVGTALFAATKAKARKLGLVTISAAIRADNRKTACPLSRGPEPINLAIPDAPRVALVLAPVKHAVRRFAVAFGHA